MSSDVLSHFGGLDELIQIIYEGVERFVLLSKVDYESWTIYLGLQGPEGRWWRGCWLEKDILQLTVRGYVMHSCYSGTDKPIRDRRHRIRFWRDLLISLPISLSKVKPSLAIGVRKRVPKLTLVQPHGRTEFVDLRITIVNSQFF